MIKAIQTVYKGYKFRSRLEARWAIAFDACGIDWQYEPEGYHLPDGTWYLPDFYLPKYGTIEIKPINQYSEYNRHTRVYMAGTMKSGEGWRGVGVTDRNSRNGSYDTYDVSDMPDQFFYDHMFIYGGPFSMSCDHGCAHSMPHMAYDCCYGDDDIDTVKNCMSQIERCDVFAIYVDRADLYGSLVELGYAKAMGKKIWYGMCPKVYSQLKKDTDHHIQRCPDHELWFGAKMADKFEIVEKSEARKKFELFLVSGLSAEHRQAVMMGENHTVIYGDPVEHKVFRTKHPALPFANELTKSAALKARQARFEHGETPR